MQSARKIIFEILLEYFSKEKNLSSLIDISLQTNRIKPLDKKLINQISKGVVRRYITLDFLISKLSGLKAENIDIFSLIAIRIALFQILYLDRIPDYSAVNESVS
ncbi:MAG: transcription antitermination factor NusB, partial [Actinomycetota bacterium]|nr:transcription antitermination factor NusB [Actinomycetota bacterium]